MHDAPDHPAPSPHPGGAVDLTIIGGGPTGLYGAFYAGLRGMTVRIVDSLPQLGGQVMALYPEKYIYDVAGFPKVLGKELVARLVEQAMQYRPAVELGHAVLSLTQTPPAPGLAPITHTLPTMAAAITGARQAGAGHTGAGQIGAEPTGAGQAVAGQTAAGGAGATINSTIPPLASPAASSTDPVTPGLPAFAAPSAPSPAPSPDQGPRFHLQTTGGVFSSRSLLISTGIGSFAPRKLGLPEEADYVGRGVYYTLARPDDLAGKRVLVVGGGDSAFDWANALLPVARSVTLAHRTDRFRAHEDSIQRYRTGGGNILTFSEVRSIAGGGAVERCTVHDNRSKRDQTLEVDAIVVSIGYHTSPGPLRDFGIDLTPAGKIRVDSTMRTTRPGLFAAGDVVDYPGKLALIATGFAEAATAVNHAKQFIDPAARVFPGHSSER